MIFVVGMTLAAQGRFTVTSPHGIAFSESKGSEAWRVIALSETDSSGWAATVAGLTDGTFAAADAVHVAGHVEPSQVGRR